MHISLRVWGFELLSLTAERSEPLYYEDCECDPELDEGSSELVRLAGPSIAVDEDVDEYAVETLHHAVSSNQRFGFRPNRVP